METELHYKACLLLVLVSFTKNTKAQSVSTLMGGRSAGLGYAVTTLADEWSLLNNVGGLGSVKETTIVSALEVKPTLPGANRAAAAISTPLSVGTLGAGVFHFGDELYSEQILSAGFGNQFGLASLGLKLNYIQYRAVGFATKGLFSINFGGVAEITPNILVGAYMTNLNQPHLSDDEVLPTKLSTGVQFRSSENLIIVAEIEKDLTYSPTVKGGFEYTIHKKVLARSGFNINPNAAFAGLGYRVYRMQLDYALQWNSTIRMTHQMSINFRLSKPK